jgi:hypothetical protein
MHTGRGNDRRGRRSAYQETPRGCRYSSEKIVRKTLKRKAPLSIIMERRLRPSLLDLRGIGYQLLTIMGMGMWNN